MFVGQRPARKSDRYLNQNIGYLREWDWSKFTTFQPVNGRGINGHCFFRADVWAVFEVAVLTFLFGLEIQA